MPSEGLRPGPRGRHCWEIHLLHFVIFREQDSLIQMRMVYTVTFGFVVLVISQFVCDKTTI